MKRRVGTCAVMAATALAGIVFLMASTLAAQAPTAAQPVRQEVPNNPLKAVAATQPIPYSHKMHLALNGVQCQTCHTAPGTGELMTFPAASTCMRCHANVAKDKSAIQKLAQFAKGNAPIPWVRVYTIRPSHAGGERAEPYEKSSGVVWSHRTHLAAGAKCEMCHGQVAQMETMAEVTSVATMGGCIACHARRSTSAAKSNAISCTPCHVWFQDKALGQARGVRQIPALAVAMR